MTPAELLRDRWGRPLIIPPDGGKPVPYTRASKLGSAVGDHYSLNKWKQRQVALGLAKRPDLLTTVGARHDDPKALDDICGQAMEAAGASAGATMGTALHELTQIVDLGGSLTDHVPRDARRRVDVYLGALHAAGLETVLVERFVVNDALKTAGTFDRLLRAPDGRTLIADLKTGMGLITPSNALWPDRAIEMSIQLAVYADGQLYDPATGNREPLDDHLDVTRGIVIALPALGGPCHLIRLDLTVGLQLAHLATWVLEARKTKGIAETRLIHQEN